MRRSLTSSLDLSTYLATLRGRSDGTVTALSDVSLRVKQGEVFGLLGPNGAGKTTLIKILSTLVLPDSGSAKVYGIDVVRKPRLALRKLQTVLAQSTGFEIRLSGRRNLELYAALYGIPKETAKKRVNELMKFTRLEDRADSVFQSYSTGMARKLLVCRALLSDASLLIFDEPTSSLDPVTAKEFRDFMSRDLVKHGRTIFLATHNLHEAEEICDRIALIQKGRLMVVGTPSEVRGMVGDRVNVDILLDGINGEAISTLIGRLKVTGGVTDVSSTTSVKGVNLSIVGNRKIDYNSVMELILRTGSRMESLQVSEPSLEEAFMSLMRYGES